MFKGPRRSQLQIIDTASETISDEDNTKLLKFVMENLNHEIVITDVATEIYDENTRSVIDNSDLIVMFLHIQRCGR